jgi:hypothetical protein
MYRAQKTLGSITITIPAHLTLTRRIILAGASIFALNTADAASLNLGWTAPSNLTNIASYELHYGLASGQYQSVSNISGATSVSTTVSGLNAGTTYYFALRSRNADGSVVSAYSNEVSATTASSSDTTAPTVSVSAAPTGPSYTTAQTVTITATATDNVGVSKVEFYDGTTLAGTDTSSPFSYAWSVTSAANGTHNWTAKAYDAANNVGTSTVVSLSAAIAIADTTAPTTPASLTATPTSASAVNLSWTASTDNVGVTGYLVERCQGTGCTTFAQVATTTATTVANTGLTANTSYNYRVRTVDAAANRSGYSNTAAATTPASAPASTCTGTSVWAATATPSTLAYPDTASVELGMKFKSDVDGYICGVRFYKSTANTGTHVGSLWSSTGTLLAKATFTQESASGWQQMNFATPVAIKAATVYVVSYLAPKGMYSANGGYFTWKGVDNAPLHALKNAVSGGNGVYKYGSGGFPTMSYNATNYWVDVVFMNSSAVTAAASLAATPETTRPNDSIGVYRPRTMRFYLDTDASFDLSGNDITSEVFGVYGDVPLRGDWTGDGTDKIGVYRPSTHTFILDLDGDYRMTDTDQRITTFGIVGDLPVIGDWNGDGIDKIGVYRPSEGRFYLDMDNSESWTTGDVKTARFGQAGDLPVIGDWTGDGVGHIGVYRPSTGRFYLDADNSYSWTTGDVETDTLGTTADLPVIGNWNADGADEVGVYRPSTQVFYLDLDGSYSWTAADLQTAAFGKTGDKPLSGQWQPLP